MPARCTILHAIEIPRARAGTTFANQTRAYEELPDETKRRIEPHDPGIYVTDLEKMIGRAREHLEFTIWYLMQIVAVTTAYREVRPIATSP